MADLYFGELAEEQYVALERDQTRWSELDEVDRVLDALSSDPDQARFRQRRMQHPPVWVVPFSVPSGEAWVVLWSEYAPDPTAIHVHYVGPASFA